jgi:hypothetical protein
VLANGGAAAATVGANSDPDVAVAAESERFLVRERVGSVVNPSQLEPPAKGRCRPLKVSPPAEPDKRLRDRCADRAWHRRKTQCGAMDGTALMRRVPRMAPEERAKEADEQSSESSD